MRNNVVSVWTEETIAELTQLWKDGYSCSQIAEQIGRGVTRNAVIGKVFRLGLPGRGHVSVYSRAINPLPRIPRPIVRSRERKPRLKILNPNEKPSFITMVSPITGQFTGGSKRKRPPLLREMTKSELRAMLAQAVQNTAAMESQT